MNEQLQKELAAWLATMRDAAQQGANFAIEQAPLIVREKVAYGRVRHTAMIGIEIVLLVVVTYWLVRAVKRALVYEPVDHLDDGILPWVICVPPAILVTILVISFMETFPYAVQVWFAPRLYVIEWLAGLLK